MEIEVKQRTSINIVWLKRDFRTQDHAPLQAAEAAGLPYLILTFFEPSLLAYPDASLRHQQFVFHSLHDLRERLQAFGLPVDCCYGEAVDIFRYFGETFDLQTVFSHQESGIRLTWERDQAVRECLDALGVEWCEFQRDGIVRGIRDRKGWDASWTAAIESPMIRNEYREHVPLEWENPFPLAPDYIRQLEDYPTAFQPPGEGNAWRYLRSFTEKRGFRYHRFLSKPLDSRRTCARVSPYLAWGNLSVRQTYHWVHRHPNYRKFQLAFSSFLTRLHWHCHFIQKFEVECEYETHCINRGYELLEHEPRPDFVEAWKAGKTGVPLVDACMRCVAATGWINFRMRAMVVSFFAHNLDQDWRSGVYHLARQFLDYEPGIHYPQFQMQSGTTGTNTVRMYNPVKQSLDHDPEGTFIKTWIPELERLPLQYLHEPWKMTSLEQALFDFVLGRDYPAPLVDLVESAQKARKKIWGHRSNELVIAERKRILKTHVRKKR